MNKTYFSLWLKYTYVWHFKFKVIEPQQQKKYISRYPLYLFHSVNILQLFDNKPSKIYFYRK